MLLSPLTAVSPIDGRYRDKIEKLGNYFSEFALIRYRVLIEVEYFITLCELPLPQLADIDSNIFLDLRKIYQDFSMEDAETIKATEKITNHDVKAVEYFLKKKLEELKLSHFEEFVHFGLTSQDINNTATPLMFKEACEKVLFPEWDKVLNSLHQMSEEWRNIPMLAYTHGQPASPTRLGKEIKVFAYRLEKQLNELKNIKFPAKFGGATGNFNAHHVAYPYISWQFFADNFVNDRLGLERSSFTTQIENYDQLAAIFDNFRRCNTIMIDFCRDVWQYVSMGYFKQKIKENEVGSSAMPHKVNPIDFENAEGNLGIANAIFEHLSAKLPISRLQRDLTDSTVLRNLGVPLAHTSISLQSILKGISKLQINEAKIKEDLDDNWAVVAEAIQTILRREGYPKPYEALKSLTRKNEKITAQTIHQFVEELNVSEAVKKELSAITPFNYTGI
jgi:adenylosuccinate lyase